MYFYFLIVTLLVAQGQEGSERNVSGEVPAPGTPNTGLSDTICQKGWKRFENSTHCLKYFSETMPYTEARKTCQEVGGDLAQTDSEAKNRFVRAFFSDAHEVWIGVVYEQQDQHWAYVDGTPTNYSNWMYPQPPWVTNRHCVSMSDGEHWVVNVVCDKNLNFVCEMDADPSPSYLKNEIVKLKHEMKSKDEAFEEKLQSVQDLFNKSDQEHESELIALQNLVDKAENDKEQTVSFAATHNRKGHFAKGEGLIFSTEIENVGRAYSKRTGVFTARYPGYYFFSLSVFTSSKQFLFVDLRNGRGEILATLRSGDGAGWFGQGTATCIVKMAAGDQVKPVIGDVSGGSPVATRYYDDRLNLFYGYLLRRL